MSSRRLPGKIMKIVDGKPVLYHVINQLSHSKLLKKIVIATSTGTDDDIVENYTKKSINILLDQAGFNQVKIILTNELLQKN